MSLQSRGNQPRSSPNTDPNYRNELLEWLHALGHSSSAISTIMGLTENTPVYEPNVAIPDDYSAGRYVWRPVLNTGEVTDQANKIGLPPLEDDLHVTIADSVDHDFPVELETHLIKATPVGGQMLGARDAVVVNLDCPELEDRFDTMINDGAVSSYGMYNCHLTLFYSKGWAEYNSSFPVPDFDIILGPEHTRPIRRD